MIRYFLDEESQITIKQRKIIQKLFIKRRKYNPFHLECQYTKKKLCYCKKNPIAKMSQRQKAHLWKKDYIGASIFYDKEIQHLLKESSQSHYKGGIIEKKQQAQKMILQQSGEAFERSIEKIRTLNRQECINFVKSIKQTQRTTNILSQPDANI